MNYLEMSRKGNSVSSGYQLVLKVLIPVARENNSSDIKEQIMLLTSMSFSSWWKKTFIEVAKVTSIK